MFAQRRCDVEGHQEIPGERAMGWGAGAAAILTHASPTGSNNAPITGTQKRPHPHPHTSAATTEEMRSTNEGPGSMSKKATTTGAKGERRQSVRSLGAAYLGFPFCFPHRQTTRGGAKVMRGNSRKRTREHITSRVCGTAKPPILLDARHSHLSLPLSVTLIPQGTAHTLNGDAQGGL